MKNVIPLSLVIAACAGAPFSGGVAQAPHDGSTIGSAVAPASHEHGTVTHNRAASTDALRQARTCAGDMGRRRSMRLQQALEGGFGVQYWGQGYDAEALARQPHGVLIIEAAKVGAAYSRSGREEFFTPQEIALVRREGARPVFAYLNLGEIEMYRDYWVDLASRPLETILEEPPDWFGPRAGDGGHLAAYWTAGWRKIVLDRVDRLMSAGVDGLFLDDVLHYYSHASDASLVWPRTTHSKRPGGAKELALAMMDLVIAVADRARGWNCEALVLVNNAVFIGRDAAEPMDEKRARPVFDRYIAAIDGIMVENAMAPTAHPHTRAALVEDFLQSGAQVMTLDAASRFPETDYETLRQRLSREALQAGFTPYVVEAEGFNRLYPPVAVSAR